MTHALTYDFSVDKENKKITVKRQFAAKRDLVWDAYTKSEILDQWWAPKPWKAQTKSMDFRVGGQWLYAMVGPKDEKQWSVEQYTKIVPKMQFSTRDGFSDEQGKVDEKMPQSAWDVTFADHGDHTHVQIVLTFEDEQSIDAILKTGFKEGLAMGMDNLDKLLEEKR